MAFKDLTGMKFGRFEVLRRVENRNGEIYYECRCECGTIKIVRGKDLRYGKSQSCGCLARELAAKANTTHAMTDSKYHRLWRGVKTRCYNPNCKQFKDYGGRGITMYADWINDFKAFYDYISTLEHFGEKGYTLDRKDNDGNYEPGNLKWSTRAEQLRNRRNTVFVEFQGRKMTLAEATELSGIRYGVLLDRYHKGKRGADLFAPSKKR